MIDSLMGLLAVQSLLLAAWLLSQRLMLPLAAWLGVLALHMGANLAAPALGLTGLTQSLGLLHGPLLWLWVRHLVRAQALGAPAAGLCGRVEPLRGQPLEGSGWLATGTASAA